MFRNLLFAIPALAAFALIPAAHATSIYVYSLSSPTSAQGQSGISGSITIEGSDGAALPALDSASVLSWNFDLDGFVHWDSSTAQVLSDDLSFDGTLGAATLQGTSGEWEVFRSGESNAALYLFGGTDPARYHEKWGWCPPGGDGCGDLGNSYTFTLVSATPEVPEPSTAALLMGAVAAFGATRARRTKRA